MHLRIVLIASLTFGAACSGQPAPATSTTPAPSPSTPAAAAPAVDDTPIPPSASPYDSLPGPVREALFKPFLGDFPQMVERRVIRAGVTYNRTHYFVDKGRERGLSFEALESFEKELNATLKRGNLEVHVVITPMSRDQLAPALVNGGIDMVVANVTVRPELEAIAAFSEPTRTDVNQVVVTGPGAPAIASVDDLSGQSVFVRKASPYFDSLTRLNAQLTARGKAPVVIDEAPAVLEDDDILEMTNAGLAPITVVDDYLATFWRQVFTQLTVHDTVTVRTGGHLAVAMRKDNPLLRDEVNKWLRRHGKGDLFRNVIEKRYLHSVAYAKNAAADAERRKFLAVIELFRKYGAQYDLDYLLIAAQGYQESTLDHSVRSPVGAIGVMQVMPATGKELAVGDIKLLEPNVHAGVKYMRQMMDRNFKDEPMDPMNRALMTFASYNAGPGRVRQLRRETRERGLDPNVWFGNVERIASERIGRETVTYVGSIFKYYVAYRLLADQAERRQAAKAAVPRK
jgi:membrane-bound lytic murein transglycosylase MltF